MTTIRYLVDYCAHKDNPAVELGYSSITDLPSRPCPSSVEVLAISSRREPEEEALLVLVRTETTDSSSNITVVRPRNR